MGRGGDGSGAKISSPPEAPAAVAAIRCLEAALQMPRATASGRRGGLGEMNQSGRRGGSSTAGSRQIMPFAPAREARGGGEGGGPSVGRSVGLLLLVPKSGQSFPAP